MGEIMGWSGIDRRTEKNLLYLDDNEDSLMLFEATAKALGFQMKTVKYQSDFITEFETGLYDAAYVDFLLTLGDGIDLMRLLHKEKAPNTKLFIFSAYNHDAIKKKLNGDKINGILDKADGIQKALAGAVNG